MDTMRKRLDHEWMRHLDFIALDILGFQLSFCLSCWICRGFGNPYESGNLHYITVLTLSQLAAIAFESNYFAIIRRDMVDELVAILRSTATTMLIALVYLFVEHRLDGVSRLLSGTIAVMFVIVDLLVRQFNKWRIRVFRTGEKRKALVLVTSAALVRHTIEKLREKSAIQYYDIKEIVLLDGGDVSRFDDLGLPVYVLDEDAVQNMCHMHVDEVFVFQPEDMVYPRRFINDLREMGLTIHYANAFLENFAEFHRLGTFDVLTTSIRMASAFELAIKRLMDILGGLVGCFFTGLIFIFVAPAIYIQSPGPIFFTQKRVGENGKIFKMYKFRSMYMDAEKRKAELMAQNRIQDGMMFKMDDDPRIIGSEKKGKDGKPKGIGNFIRNTSLDEFPQFFNVLKGDMSLVGTRPPTMDEWSKYDLRHRARMSAKPGITGMWQVSGRSKIIDFEEVVALDRYYIEHWSLELDIQILLRTVAAVLKHDGAL